MRDTFDAVLTTLIIALLIAFLGWHARRADQAVEQYSHWLEQQLPAERWAVK